MPRTVDQPSVGRLYVMHSSSSSQYKQANSSRIQLFKEVKIPYEFPEHSTGYSRTRIGFIDDGTLVCYLGKTEENYCRVMFGELVGIVGWNRVYFTEVEDCD